MRRNFALLSILLIIVVTLIPAYYSLADDSLLQNSPSDVAHQVFTTTGSSADLAHHQCGAGVSLSRDIAYHLLHYIPSSTGTRSPPR